MNKHIKKETHYYYNSIYMKPKKNIKKTHTFQYRQKGLNINTNNNLFVLEKNDLLIYKI